MSTIENKKNALFAVSSIILMIGGGFLLDRTLTVFYDGSSALSVVSLSLLSVLLYTVGVFLMGRCTDRKHIRRSYAGISSGAVFALLLIAFGMLLLGFNTGYLPSAWKIFFFSWPMLLFIAGILYVCRGRLILGVILAVTGKFFLFSRADDIYLYDIHKQFLSTYWPVFIIVLGVFILLSILITPRLFTYNEGRKESYTGNQDGKIDYRSTFSGTEQVILDPIFKGGNIETTFGGINLDLRRTSLAEGDTFLNVQTTFGGIEIKAPDSWEIEIHSSTFAGGVNDSRMKNNDKDKSRKLIILAKCTFGGIEIK
jgi:predicted membrane protein